MSTISNSYLIRVRAATETQWALDDPILADGEPAYSSDVNQWKIGDGTTAWTSLSYVYGPAGPQGPIGPEGPPAPSVNFLGSVADSGSLPGTANLGDAYLVTNPDPDEMWVYGSSGWVYAGVAGIPGPEGPEGPQGPTTQEIAVTSIQPTDPDVDIWVHPTENLDGWGLMDARYVNGDGDSMTGPLKLGGSGMVGAHGIELDRDDGPTESVWLRHSTAPDSAAQLRVSDDANVPQPISCADPVWSDQAATKGYVDGILVHGRWTGTLDNEGKVTVTQVPAGYRIIAATPNGPDAAAYPNLQYNAGSNIVHWYYGPADVSPWLGKKCALWSMDFSWIAVPE